MNNNETESVGQVYSSELNSIIVRVDDLKKIEKVKDSLGIGSLLNIKNGRFSRFYNLQVGFILSTNRLSK